MASFVVPLGLSEDQKTALRGELLCKDEGPILVVKENPAWNTLHRSD